MRTINLFMKQHTKIPLEFDNILPELLYDKTDDEIGNTLIYHGNRRENLSDYFNITTTGKASSGDECVIIINGNLDRVKYIGLRMSKGQIIANGDVDMHLGAQMQGGEIIVNGNAESYVGREMKGGNIIVNGDVKEFCGASYMGEWRGMNGGCILINGNAGRQLGECMSGGEIIVNGNCDMLPAIHMTGGYIQINGDITKWPAGQMKRGVIVVNGNVGEILEGFTKKEVIQNPQINGEYHIGKYALYMGDETVRGKAQLWIKQ